MNGKLLHTVYYSVSKSKYLPILPSIDILCYDREEVFYKLGSYFQIGASLPQLIQIIGQALMEDELKKGK